MQTWQNAGRHANAHNKHRCAWQVGGVHREGSRREDHHEDAHSCGGSPTGVHILPAPSLLTVPAASHNVAAAAGTSLGTSRYTSRHNLTECKSDGGNPAAPVRGRACGSCTAGHLLTITRPGQAAPKLDWNSRSHHWKAHRMFGGDFCHDKVMQRQPRLTKVD